VSKKKERSPVRRRKTAKNGGKPSPKADKYTGRRKGGRLRSGAFEWENSKLIPVQSREKKISLRRKGVSGVSSGEGENEFD